MVDRYDSDPHDSWSERELDRANVQVERLEDELRTLTRITAGVMETLQEVGQEDFVLLKNPEIRKWWHEYKVEQVKDAKYWLDKTKRETAEKRATYLGFEEALKEREQIYEDLKKKLKV